MAGSDKADRSDAEVLAGVEEVAFVTTRFQVREACDHLFEGLSLTRVGFRGERARGFVAEVVGMIAAEWVSEQPGGAADATA